MKLSIIIVNYKTPLLLKNCLSKLKFSLEYSGLFNESETIVIDNATDPKEIDPVKNLFPWIKIIGNKYNKGFAAANNQGIKMSQGKFILLLNTDTEVEQNTSGELLEILEKEPLTAVAGCKLINKDGTIQPSMGYFPSLIKVLLWMSFFDDIPILTSLIKPYHVETQKYYSRHHEVDWVSGACFIIKKEAVLQAGFIDENIFMYGEEVEWCYRIKKKGFRVIYTPLTSVLHLKGASGKGNISGIAEEFSGLIFFYKKHYPGWQGILLRILLITGALLRMMIFGIITGNPAKVKLYAEAVKMVRR